MLRSVHDCLHLLTKLLHIFLHVGNIAIPIGRVLPEQVFKVSGPYRQTFVILFHSPSEQTLLRLIARLGDVRTYLKLDSINPLMQVHQVSVYAFLQTDESCFPLLSLVDSLLIGCFIDDMEDRLSELVLHSEHLLALALFLGLIRRLFDHNI